MVVTSLVGQISGHSPTLQKRSSDKLPIEAPTPGVIFLGRLAQSPQLNDSFFLFLEEDVADLGGNYLKQYETF